MVGKPAAKAQQATVCDEDQDVDSQTDAGKKKEEIRELREILGNLSGGGNATQAFRQEIQGRITELMHAITRAKPVPAQLEIWRRNHDNRVEANSKAQSALSAAQEALEEAQQRADQTAADLLEAKGQIAQLEADLEAAQEGSMGDYGEEDDGNAVSAFILDPQVMAKTFAQISEAEKHRYVSNVLSLFQTMPVMEKVVNQDAAQAIMQSQQVPYGQTDIRAFFPNRRPEQDPQATSGFQVAGRSTAGM